MDSETLRIFICVASELSVTQAAAHLGRAPSNVSTRIQQLEADVGVALFVRTGKRMALSVAGERFVDYAQKLLALEAETRHVVTGGRVGGVLRIGSMESTAASRLPAVLATYHAKHACTSLQLRTSPTRTLLEQVRTGLIDCAFVALLPTADTTALMEEQGLHTRPVWQEELVLLLPSTEAGAQRAEDIRIRTLVAFPLGCTYRSMAEQFLGVAESPEWQVLEIASYHAMIACVAAGSSVALVPASVAKLTGIPHGLSTLSVAVVDTVLVWRKGYAVPAFQHLLTVLAGESQ